MKAMKTLMATLLAAVMMVAPVWAAEEGAIEVTSPLHQVSAENALPTLKGTIQEIKESELVVVNEAGEEFIVSMTEFQKLEGYQQLKLQVGDPILLRGIVMRQALYTTDPGEVEQNFVISLVSDQQEIEKNLQDAFEIKILHVDPTATEEGSSEKAIIITGKATGEGTLHFFPALEKEGQVNLEIQVDSQGLQGENVISKEKTIFIPWEMEIHGIRLELPEALRQQGEAIEIKSYWRLEKEDSKQSN